jgi:hypothetical protein
VAFSACNIENDIPYPIVDGAIQAFEVEGQCDSEGNATSQATINKDTRTVRLYVDDTVDLTRLRITRLSVSNDATLVIDSAVCNNYLRFPTTGFESLNDIAMSSDTRVNFTSAVPLTLRTYQDYEWMITITRVINRELVLQNQIGKATIDPVTRQVVIYVSQNQPLNSIAVDKFTLGGPHGSVIPDPTASETFDFSSPVTFFVQNGWEEVSYRWTVYVFHKEEETTTEADIFARTTSASISGTVQNGKSVTIDYKKASDSNWTAMSSSSVNVNGTSFSAELTKLSPGTQYNLRVNVGGNEGASQDFTTAPATPLTDGSFDNWYKTDKLWNPWAEGGESFWDTGNRGAITISESNSVPTDETCNGSGKAALLESKYLVLKFAAGNIFTGSYLRTTGTNGELSFGREFTAFPTKLRVNYKYTCQTIDKCGDDDYEYLKGRADSCHIYIALTDWDEPLTIRTRPSERQLFDKSDSHIIAYAELIKGETIANWQQVDLTLNYRATNRRPKYIVVVASASKYGDFFTGGTGSKLWVDNFELIYE